MEATWIVALAIIGFSIIVFLFFLFGGNKYRRRNYAAELYAKMAKEESKEHAPNNEHIIVREDPPKEYVNSFNPAKLIMGLVFAAIPIVVGSQIIGPIKDAACTDSMNATNSGMCSALMNVGSGGFMVIIAILAIVSVVGSAIGAFGDGVEYNDNEE